MDELEISLDTRCEYTQEVSIWDISPGSLGPGPESMKIAGVSIRSWKFQTLKFLNPNFKPQFLNPKIFEP